LKYYTSLSCCNCVYFTRTEKVLRRFLRDYGRKNIKYFQPTLVDPRSKGRFCGLSLSGIAGSKPAESWMSICCECCVLSGRGLSDGLIPRPEEPYRMCARARVLLCVIRCNNNPLHFQ